MHRQHLMTLLARYAKRWPQERELVDRFQTFGSTHEDCLLRTCVPGHITSSAWILTPNGDAALMTHHKKLGRWLQLGGHVDGESQIEQACLREAQEESGMQNFTFVPWFGDELVPLDLDVHEIPARKQEPLHEHWDVRFLLRAAPGQELVMSDESNQLQWAPVASLAEFTDEESVLRLHRKALEVQQ
ncbi:MAG: 8-oxo-dGTP pyrophosphatase MutT (NUDIX family) [Hyphomicrobiaceae bacterium]|jgi:8-oxo-dGTP pyrophosphatase MutT (NUDIX family)